MSKKDSESENDLRHEEKDEEDEESLLDCIDLIALKVMESESKPYVVVPEKERLVRGVYYVIRRIVRGTDLCVDYQLHSPFPSTGSVSVTGRKITFSSPALFASIIEIAENFDIYTKLDGTAEMDLSFNGMTRKVRE